MFALKRPAACGRWAASVSCERCNACGKGLWPRRRHLHSLLPSSPCCSCRPLTHVCRCLDEISTGLDSAATLDIVVSLRAICQAFGYVVAISLLQPAPEVFALFDEASQPSLLTAPTPTTDSTVKAQPPSHTPRLSTCPDAGFLPSHTPLPCLVLA